ncbi:hypothetical protein [Nocardia goodfellowii]|uniref:ANTAR domain-containing protein n=1 Tax=Nocardia goodfellowii TaxID=882446 RepID=A0ABS4QD90_9NOCA|nr:hypothetical protein [Nocardia goodfellowii]MBP2189661.1 hypothetical protein [Nocardia goodfellowii]
MTGLLNGELQHRALGLALVKARNDQVLQIAVVKVLDKMAAPH